MGRGDKRTRKGKIAAGSFGKTRPRKKNKVKIAVGSETAKTVKPEVKENA